MTPVPGRAAESARLEALCRDAARGHGGFALVSGEAGIGKSRLAQAATEAAAAAGLVTARGWCVDDAAAPPLWPWRRIGRDIAGLREAVEGAAAADAGDGAAWRLAESVLGALIAAGGGRGLLVVVEDLHWADAPSLDLLRRLLPELGTAPVVVLGTARTEHASPAFERTLPHLLRHENAVDVPLAGLAEDDVVAWLSAEPQLRSWVPRAAELVRWTGGNPFYINTLLSELPDPAGDVTLTLTDRPTWRAVLVQAYRALPEPTRRAVATGAVMGERLSPALLADALGEPVHDVSPRLADAVTAGILHFGTTGLAFRHALVRDAIVAELAAPQRESAHAGCAAALERTEDPLLAGPAAVHWSHVAGSDAARRCRDLAVRAAAVQALAPDRAADLAHLALDSARALGASPAETAELLLLATRYDWSAGRLREALEACETGQDLAESAGRPDLMADFALVPQGVGSFDVAQIAGAMCRRALAALPDGETARRAGLLGLCAVAEAEAAQSPHAALASLDGPRPVAVADTLSAQALDAARASGNDQAELEAIAARHFVLSYPQAIEERSLLAARAAELAPVSTTTMGALWGLLWQADLAFQRGDVVAVRQIAEDVARVGVRRSSPVGHWHALRLSSAADVLVGRFDESRAASDEARVLADRVGDLSMMGMHFAFRANLAQLRGDPGELLPNSLEVLHRAPPIPLVRVGVPVVHALQGDLGRARAEFAALRHVPARMPLGPRWLGTVGQIGQTAVLLGDAEVSRDCHRLLLPCAPWCGGDGGGSPFASGSVEFLLGELAGTAGDRAAAAEHYTRGIAVDDRIGARPYAALGRLGLARAVADDDPLRARALLAEALQEFERLGMPGHLARARSLDDDLAARCRRLDARPAGLSGRELEVARLVGQALTNQQIAERLFLSVRTVESHVRSTLTKLDLTSRTQIALWLHDHDPEASRRPGR